MRSLTRLLTLSIAIIALSFVSTNAQGFTRGTTSLEKSIEQQVFRKLIYLPRYGVFDHINYRVEGSTVILGGKVYSIGTKRDAAAEVTRVPGVTAVINNIDQLPPSPYDNGIRHSALRTFSATGLGIYLREPRPSVRIVVENGRLTLEGYVSNQGDWNAFNVMANGVPGTFRVQNNLIVGNQMP